MKKFLEILGAISLFGIVGMFGLVLYLGFKDECDVSECDECVGYDYCYDE